VQYDCLYQRECIKGLSQLEAGSVDLAFADPPFNIGYDYDVYDDRSDSDKYLAWTREWGQAVQRVLKPTGTFWLAIGDEYAAELKLIFQEVLGFTCRSWVIWYYTFGVNCTKKFSRSHVHLFHFVKDPKRFTFNAMEPAVRVPSARQLVYADSRGNPDGRLPDDTWILRPQDLPEGFQADEDTWYFSRVCGTFKERAGWHGCQMPEQLLGRIIRVSSNPGDLVLDPFGGSGTTLVVAKKLGRRWIGFEISPNYAAQAQTRLDAASEGQPLEGAEEPKLSAPPTAAGKRRQDLPKAILSKRSEPSDIKRGIVEAFFAVRDGFSADRVIADPELNGRFLEACKRLGLPGGARHWNHTLLNLRKAKHFTGLPRSRRSELSRDEIDRYSYACEIGLQHLKSKEQTLDEVLCEPAEAARFDSYVRPMIAEEVSSFKIRWVALYIRKRAHEYPQAMRELKENEFMPLPKKKQLVSSLDKTAIPPVTGLYWLQSAQMNLYVGKALDLRQRFQLQLTDVQFDFWGAPRQELTIRYHELPGVDDTLLKGNQSYWIARWQPVGNYLDLALA
jgi:site-specific DNA-methyltransferase (adenine-specific)